MEQKQLKQVLAKARKGAGAEELKRLGISPNQIEPAIERMSMARAAAVARELKRLGVSGDQISTSSAIGGGRRVYLTIQ
jgi:hypothetical protein